MPPASAPPLRTWPKKLALTLISTALALLSAELIARLFLLEDFTPGEITHPTWAACARYDPDYGWTNRPLARVRILAPPIDYHVQINSQGFRDPDRQAKPAPGVRRILLLGDSMSWGWGVEQSERFGDLLAARLGPTFEVINLAVPGYGTDQELWLLLEKGLSFEPDLVLLGFVLNDVVDAQRKVRYRMYKPRYRRGPDGTWNLENRPAPPPREGEKSYAPEGWRRWSANSALITWIGALGARAPDAAGGAAQMKEESPDEEFASVMPVIVTAEQIEGYCDQLADPDSVTYMLLGRLAETCRTNGIPLLAFSMPHNHDQYLYNPAAAPPDGVAIPESLLARRLREAGAQLAFETLSIDRELFAAASAGTNLDCGDGHYNAAGNRVVAGALEPRIRQLLAAAPK